MKSLLCFALLTMVGCSSSSSPVTNNPNTPGSGKQRVSGTVKSAATDALLSGATVSLITYDTFFTVFTSAQGTFMFDSVPTGLYSITAYLPGYATDNENEFVHVDSGTNVSVTMKLSPLPHFFAADSGLVCLYRFAGNVLDSSIKHHDGQIHGCTYVADRFGHVQNAISFNGTSDFVMVADHPDLNFSNNSDFTIGLWVACDTQQGTDVNVLAKYPFSSPGNRHGYEVKLKWPSRVSGYIEGSNGSRNIDASPDAMVGDKKWHFIVMTNSATTNYVTFYIDGQPLLPQSTGAASGDFTSTSPLFFASDGWITNYKGALDDVRIYRRVISPTEITTLYHENGW